MGKDRRARPRGHGQAAGPEQPAERRWIWYRSERTGRAIARDELEALPVEGRAALAKVMQRYRDGQYRGHDVDSMGDGIFELRCRHGNDQFRLLFTSWGPHLIARQFSRKKRLKLAN